MPPTTAAPATGPFPLARAFTFAGEDPDWMKKMLIGGVMMLLSGLVLPSIVAAGYMVRVLRRTAEGQAHPLPEWDDWGGLVGDGLKMIGLYLVHFAAVAFVPMLLGGILLLIAGPLAASARSKDAEGAAAVVAAMGLVGVYVLLGVGMVLLLAYLPAAFTRSVLADRFGAGLEVRENVAYIRRNVGPYALAIVGFLLANLLSQFGVLLCCIGVFPAAFWAACVAAWGLGEVARRDAAR